MSRMADLHVEITEALLRGERPKAVAAEVGVSILQVLHVLCEIQEG
jgi:hypothetical protein|tara:strand:- start:278 stop:415 length:138 start_codon:yes stop_codon:yes gene_type:complete